MNKKRSTILAPILVLLVLSLWLLTGCGTQKDAPITRLSQLSEPGRKIGVEVDCPEEALLRHDYPNAEIVPYGDRLTAYADVENGRIDALVYSRSIMELAIENGLEGVRLLDEPYNANTIAVGISPLTPIPNFTERLNTFIAERKSDGTLDDMYFRWVLMDNETMPNIPLPEKPTTHLRVGTTGTLEPYSYYFGTRLRGYDIELAYRFAAWLGADVEFKIYDFSGLVAAAKSGDVDCIMSNLYYTPERAASIPYSNALFTSENAVMVRDASGASASGSALHRQTDLSHAKIGVATGSIFPDILQEELPTAEVVYFNTTADLVNALKGGKIDAFMQDAPVARNMLVEDGALAIHPSALGHFEFAAAFTKSERGQALCKEYSDYLRALLADGTLERLQHKWFDSADLSAMESLDYRTLPAENGTIRLATVDYPPFVLSVEGFYSGYDIEIMAMFCQERGYALEIDNFGFSGTLPAVQSGKSDAVCGGLSVTEERKETLYFAEPNFSGGAALVVLKDAEDTDSGGFLASVKDSFHKTFIRENRWKLFLEGIGTTLLITVLSIILGTALGFGVFLLCRKGNPFANAVTRFFVWLVQGMPMVVLLMILYYIIFGKVAISGTVVSIIGFTLVFGAATFGMLKSGVGAVEKGQTEAAYSLGYNDRRAFFRVVLPQALPHFFPAYKGEITATIKATAIVGYVAVQDLTKMGDIVRSRTYEAFFPLIAVAIIYFILAGILTAIVNRLGKGIDPRRRKREDILKGVTAQ